MTDRMGAPACMLETFIEVLTAAILQPKDIPSAALSSQDDELPGSSAPDAS